MLDYLLVGPHIGDFQNEITNFFPYVNWLKSVVEHKEIFVGCYYNRNFLYEDCNIVQMSDSLSRNESNQIKSINTKIKSQEFKAIIKEFRDKVIELKGCRVKDLDIYTLPYNKSNFQVPLHNKIYKKINVDIKLKDEYKNKILFIPERKNPKKIFKNIFNTLNENYDIIVLGDMKCALTENNILLEQKDYFINVYKYIIKTISESKAIITPNSHWALLANLYNKPLFTWGNTPSLYKTEGTYSFENKNVMSLPFSKGTPVEFLTKTLYYFLERTIK